MRQDVKEQIKRYYDQEAALRDGKSVRPGWKAEFRQAFLDRALQEGKKTLLELGAGAGYDSRFFQDGGLRVTAVDLSTEMVRRCRAKSVEAYELELCRLSELERQFDCLYTLNVLLHIPREDLRQVLAEMDRVLAPEGLVCIGIYGGSEDRELCWRKPEVSDAERYFCFYARQSLLPLLEERFVVLSFDTYMVGEEENTFHSILLQKRREQAAFRSEGRERKVQGL